MKKSYCEKLKHSHDTVSPLKTLQASTDNPFPPRDEEKEYPFPIWPYGNRMCPPSPLLPPFTLKVRCSKEGRVVTADRQASCVVQRRNEALDVVTGTLFRTKLFNQTRRWKVNRRTRRISSLWTLSRRRILEGARRDMKIQDTR